MKIWLEIHSALWKTRLDSLRHASTDSLEAGMAIAALTLLTIFASHWNVGVINYMVSLCPRWGWILMTFLLAAISIVGYMENRLTLRRTGGFLSSVFWLYSGILIFRGYPYAALLHGFQFLLWSFVWTRVGQQGVKAKVNALPPEEVKLMAASYAKAERGRGRLAKMPPN